MTQHTTPTSGAADLPEALRLADILDLLAMDMKTPRQAAAELRRLHSLTAQAISAEPAGAGYAALPESLMLAVDRWFADNTGLGGCSGKDVRELAELFYDVTHEGGRESVDDALAIVESFGPGIGGLNDTYARQVLLAAEVTRLRGIYKSAVAGRASMRDALRAPHGQAPAGATPLEFTKEWCMAAAKAEEDSGADISAGVPFSPQAAQQAPTGDWIERWYGSGGKEGYEGWSIVNKDDRALVAYLGRNVEAAVVTQIVMTHNATITTPTPQATQQAPSSYGSPELQAMIVARCVEKDRAQQAPAGATLRHLEAVIKGAADKLDAAVRCPQNAVDALIHEALEILDGDREPYCTPSPQPAPPADSQQAPPADSVLEDAARLDWLDQQCGGAYGFEDMHEGNRWEIMGAYANVRQAIDAERAACKQGGQKP